MTDPFPPEGPPMELRKIMLPEPAPEPAVVGAVGSAAVHAVRQRCAPGLDFHFEPHAAA